MESRKKKIAIAVLVAGFVISSVTASVAVAGIKSNYLYNLSNFNGKIPYNEVRLHVDRARDEVYVVERGIVKIFNEAGMEVFWFGDAPGLSGIYDLAVDEKGDILLLSYDFSDLAKGPKYHITRCNYRGEPKETIQVTGVPAEFAGFFPNRLFVRDGGFLLAGTNKMMAVVVDGKGAFRKGYDLAKIIDVPEKERPDTEIFGFSLDRSGNMLFTVPVLFRAYVVSPEGRLEASFGKAGSAPGMFGIVSGIATDDQGNYLVIERLRSVVMVFDKGFRFLQEFGYRGDKPGNLIRPDDLAVGNSGKLYVTQVRNRGVAVFSLSSN